MLTRYQFHRIPYWWKQFSSVPLHHPLQGPTSTSPSTLGQCAQNPSGVKHEHDPWAAVLADVPPRIPAHSRFSATRRERFSSSLKLSRRNLDSKREYSTGASDSGTNIEHEGSIFSKPESAWDHVFNDIQQTPPLLPSRVRPYRESSDTSTNTHSRVRRQSMTAREINAFDEMFNMIFNAVSEHPNIASNVGSNDSPSDIGIGRAPSGTSTQMHDLFSKMRGRSRKLKWSAQSSGDFDRKKEEMELCDTDHQLLEWAMGEVFGESKRYEQTAREAVAQMTAGVEPETMPELQPAIYPHLIALLIRSFRDKFRDPHLALSMFDHARHLSIPSYVFGCTTPAYNELIETRWKCFRDLKGVHDALEEMTVNGVPFNARTRVLIETVRREVGERNKWEEENELESGEVWTMLTKIDELIIRHGPQTRGGALGQRQHPTREAWKHSEDSNDNWEFGKWGDQDGEWTRPREMGRRGSQSLGEGEYGRSPRERRLPDHHTSGF
ncbi:hypothetical protein PILCRDRAFT_823872 [Piloderma croceum F 1598]|uniref:Mtf2-like C-terminal domain-containing protein n=1 Tax=Piloderma croceum (strain F 1598) TaxID=765440 RepID=A0A0C3AYB4_PILCF|nr:hypothetical protein PILCRDRAFT_823872 [Piloderma croceum F 1598]